MLVLALVASLLLAVRHGAPKPSTSFASQPSGPRPVVDAKAFASEGELAFVSRSALWVLDGQNGTLYAIPVPTGFTPESPALSPDGQWVAYIATGKQMTTDHGVTWTASTIVVARSDGQDAQRLTTVNEPERAIIGWNSRTDSLAYVAPEGSLSRNPYSPPAKVELWTPEGTRLVTTDPEVEGGAWSPDGTRLAVMSDTDIPLTRHTWSTSITVFPAIGGTGTTWLRYVDTYHPNGDVTSTPSVGGQDAAYLLPIGWWPKWGIGFTVVEGNPGSPFDGSIYQGGALPLAAIATPRGVPRLLGTSMINGATGLVAASTTGALAFTNDATARPLWQNEHVARCLGPTQSCVAVAQPKSTVSMDPLWAPDGSELAFVVGQQLTTGSFAQSLVAKWYNSLSLEIYRPATGSTTSLSLGTGAVVPLWSSNGRDLLFVRNDGIWIWRGLKGMPVEVVRPLFARGNWNSYYGQVQWVQQFAWQSRR
jgi:hypothetical protein